MKVMYTGKIDNEKADAWAEKERPDLNADTRRSGETGCKGQSSWTQQERINRTDSQRPSIFSSTGTTTAGGMIDHLIEDYSGQVALKQQEIQRLSDDINRYSDEVKRLSFRIEELKSLREDIQKQLQEVS
ncbi:hypothetical protein [Nostoc sp.]|uniref:hypothetical protein n=1 Tax=Nostoc sp. TaxID=1180 RepID=UPI002FF901A1